MGRWSGFKSFEAVVGLENYWEDSGDDGGGRRIEMRGWLVYGSEVEG
jgi:hypothetical protein